MGKGFGWLTAPKSPPLVTTGVVKPMQYTPPHFHLLSKPTNWVSLSHLRGEREFRRLSFTSRGWTFGQADVDDDDDGDHDDNDNDDDDDAGD